MKLSCKIGCAFTLQVINKKRKIEKPFSIPLLREEIKKANNFSGIIPNTVRDGKKQRIYHLDFI
ncbi:MAG: hypothetical protein P8X73_02640 [Ignavibacteriaceae bacterium]